MQWHVKGEGRVRVDEMELRIGRATRYGDGPMKWRVDGCETVALAWHLGWMKRSNRWWLYKS